MFFGVSEENFFSNIFVVLCSVGGVVFVLLVVFLIDVYVDFVFMKVLNM